MNLRNKNSTIKRIIKNNLFKKKWKHSSELVRDIIYNLDIHLTTFEIREFIKELRLAGVPVIASSSKGYKLAKDKKELKEYVDARVKEIKEQLRCLNTMEVGE